MTPISSEITKRSLFLGAFVRTLGPFCVCVFFALSGFLLFREVVSGLLFDTPVTSMPHYIARRVLRIYPAYWLALAGMVVLEGTQGPGHITLGVVTLTERSLTTARQLPGLFVAWSLYIEVAFYVFIPIVGVLLARLCRHRPLQTRIAIIAASLGAMVLFSMVWTFWASTSMDSDPRLRWGLFPYLGWFVAGMVLAVLALLRQAQVRTPKVLTQLSDHPWVCWGSAIALVMVISLNRVAPDDGGETSLQLQERLLLMGIAAFLILLPMVLSTKDSLLRRFLGAPAVVGVGVISYGIYLWHVTLIRLLLDHVSSSSATVAFLSTCAFALPLSILVAWISFRLVERPALSLARPRRPRAARGPKIS